MLQRVYRICVLLKWFLPLVLILALLLAYVLGSVSSDVAIAFAFMVGIASFGIFRIMEIIMEKIVEEGTNEEILPRAILKGFFKAVVYIILAVVGYSLLVAGATLHKSIK